MTTKTVTLKTPTYTIEAGAPGTPKGNLPAIVEVPPLNIAVDYGTILSKDEFLLNIGLRRISETEHRTEQLSFIKQLGIGPLDIDARLETLSFTVSYNLLVIDLPVTVESFNRELNTLLDISSVAIYDEHTQFTHHYDLPTINEELNPVVETLFIGRAINREILEQVPVFESGLFRVQSYADPTYFAEDYVEDYRVPF